MNPKRNALGRGLSALLENPGDVLAAGSTASAAAGDAAAFDPLPGSVARIPVEQIGANPFQPREEFDAEKLEELAASIRALDIVQPVTVRRLSYGSYQLISGERRLRAAKLAGLTDIPAYVRVANDRNMLEIALVENIQREDLDAIEVALSCKRLIEECSLTQEEVSGKLGKKRSTVTNYLRLLRLPAEIQKAIRDNVITMGHARAIVGVNGEEQQLKLFHSLITQKLSVRDAEEMARERSPARRRPSPTRPAGDRHTAEVLGESLGTRVDVRRRSNGSGVIAISFADDAELDRIRTAIAGR